MQKSTCIDVIGFLYGYIDFSYQFTNKLKTSQVGYFPFGVK